VTVQGRGTGVSVHEHLEEWLNKQSFVGVDVSANTLAVIVEQEGVRGQVLDFTNDRAGHKKLISLVTKRGHAARVVLEATGNYSLDLAFALHCTKRVEVMVANPRALSQFAGAFLRRSKTDALDAEVIVEFAKRMPFRPWAPPAPACLDLRAISRRIESLTKTAPQLTRLRTHLGGNHATQCARRLPVWRRSVSAGGGAPRAYSMPLSRLSASVG
jgi:transposase